MKSAWCIHMPHRVDRDALIVSLKQFIGASEFNTYQAKKQADGKRGCYESHQAVMSLNSDEPYALVFEDDAVFVGKSGWEDEVLRFLARDDWDILYLGCFPDVFKEQTNEYGNIFRVKASMTHAYIVSQTYMKTFACRPYDGTPVDNVFRNEARTFAYLPSLFVQAETESDIGNFSSAFAWKKWIISACELYAVEVGVPIYVWFLWMLAMWNIVNGCSVR